MSETKQTETTQQPNEAARNDKRKNKTIVLLLLLLLVMIGLIGGLLYYFLIYSAKSPMARESEMLGGRLAGKTPTEMQSILDETVEKGQVLIGISAAPVFEENGKKGRLGIENDAKNQYSFQVTLTEDETGTELYKSGLIDPGYYVEFVELSKRLAAGDYAATAVFTTYSPEETDDAIAQVTAKITLHVMDGTFYN